MYKVQRWVEELIHDPWWPPFVFHLFLLMNDVKLRRIAAGVCCSVTVTKHKPTFQKAGSLFLTVLFIMTAKSICRLITAVPTKQRGCNYTARHQREKNIPSASPAGGFLTHGFKTCSENHSHRCLKTQTHTNHAHSYELSGFKSTNAFCKCIFVCFYQLKD